MIAGRYTRTLIGHIFKLSHSVDVAEWFEIRRFCRHLKQLRGGTAQQFVFQVAELERIHGSLHLLSVLFIKVYTLVGGNVGLSVKVSGVEESTYVGICFPQICCRLQDN